MADHFAARLRVPLTTFLLGMMLTACDPHEPVNEQALTNAGIGEADIAAATGEIDRLRRTVAADLLTAAAALVAATDRFLDIPGEDSMETLQTAWRNTHRQYAALFLFRPATGDATIDQWPIEPGFLDAVPGHPESGIVSDASIPISLLSLREQHGFTDPTEASLGFHPLEFLIFARDPASYSGNSETSARRREVLRIMAAELQASLKTLVEGIEPTEPSSAGLVQSIGWHRLAILDAVAAAGRIDGDDPGHTGFQPGSNESLRRLRQVLDDLYGAQSEMLKIAEHVDDGLATTIREALDESAIEGPALPLQLTVIAEQLTLLQHLLGGTPFET